MAWKISPKYKKSVTEVELFKNGSRYITRRHGWRWGYVIVDEKPDLSDYDEDVGADSSCDFGDIIDQGQDDGCWEDWVYPDDMEEKEREEIEEAWAEDWHDGVEALGWESWESEMLFEGPLDVEEVDNPEWYTKMMQGKD